MAGDADMSQRHGADMHEPSMHSKAVASGPPPRPEVKKISYFKLFRFATALDYVFIALGTLGGMANGAAMPCWALLFGDLVNAFGTSPDDMLDTINSLALAFFYLAIGSFVVSYLQMGMWMWIGARQARRIRVAFLESVLNQDIAFFDTDAGTGALLTAINEDSVLLETAMGEKVGTFIFSMSMCGAGLAIAFAKGWDLTLVMLAVLPLMGASIAFMFKVVDSTTKRSQAAYADANSIAQQALSSVRTVFSFNAEAATKEAYAAKLEVPQAMGTKQGFVTGAVLGFFQLSMFGAYGLALWYAAGRVRDGAYDGGTVLTCFFSALIGGFAVGQAGPAWGAFENGRVAGARVFAMIDRDPIIKYRSGGKKLPAVKGEIAFTNVNFSYPARPDLKVFKDFTLSVPAGTTVALVGQSGSGKSTIVSLTERYYDPLSGTVTLDGVPLPELDIGWLRDQIGLVSQEPTLFSTTIYENIKYGRPGATEAQVLDAAKASNAYKFIRQLPNGFNTAVGEGGVQLSGGQKQRIAIARALLKNPRVLLLDEATSALDAQSERLVQDALDKLMVGRTTLVVAHRLSTIRNADLICVMAEGRMVEHGTHDALLQNPGGAYAQLVALQQSGPADNSAPASSGRTVKASAADEEEEEEEEVLGVEQLPAGAQPPASNGSPGKRGCLGLFRRKKAAVLPDEEAPLSAAEEEEKPKPVSMGRLLKLNAREWPLMVLGVTSSMGLGSTMPLFAVALSSIIAVFYNPDPEDMKRKADLWAGIFGLVGLGSFICTLVQQASLGIMGARLSSRVRVMLFEAMLKQEVGWFDRDENNSGSLTARLGTDATYVRGAVGDAAGLLFQNVTTFAVGFTIAFINGWKMTLVIIAAVPLIVISGLIQAKIGQGFTDGTASKEAAGADQVATEAFRNIRVVQAFNLQASVTELWERFSAADASGKSKRAHVTGIGFGFSQFAMFAVYGLAFWYGGQEVVAGRMTLEEMLKVFFAVIMGAMGASQGQMAFPDAAKAGGAVKRIFEVIDRTPRIDPNADKAPPGVPPAGELAFTNVAFTYPARRDVTIFKDLCLSVDAGRMVALVGESGSGKSTVIGLTERFYDVAAGSVTLDGRDLRDLPLSWVREHVGLVSQEPTLFAMTVADNIKLGRPGATDEEVAAAAATANAAGFIEKLPEGYGTYVGERGVQLSGGQKQRVAIARAVLKDPRVLLLDEATSALDAESERLVQDALEKLMAGRTTVVVAHRLSTIRRADIIAVMKKGVIVERGTHDELLRIPDGAYSALVRLQQAAGH
eukprot:jgi/Tetstr1/432832/TSEL_022182.t2